MGKLLQMNFKRWSVTAFFNLLIIAFIGVILRLKIICEIPFIDQKQLLHGHSHFAFSGWVSQALMAFIVWRLSFHAQKDLFQRYNTILFSNLLSAYGMLISFPLQGYGIFSNLFSIWSFLTSYIFAIMVWQDILRIKGKHILFRWVLAAVSFNCISTLGGLYLAYMTATHTFTINSYLASSYFYLHFQYNGWFLFVILGLLCEKLEEIGVQRAVLVKIFALFAFACIPAYFLSALWLPIPLWVYVLVVAAAFLQTFGWVWTFSIVLKKKAVFQAHIGNFVATIVLLSFIALSIKLMLQLGSTIPALSTMAFAFRPIIVGYLHLVLLGVVTLFVIGYGMYSGVLSTGSKNKAGITLFVLGVVLNELCLMVQGVAYMRYIPLSYFNEILLGVTCLIFSGVFVINYPISKRASITN
jgi:hypothetical protein